MWRLPTEACSPELAGHSEYAKQVPLDRAVPLWGGVSAGGFAAVLVHSNKKLTDEEWAGAVDSGRLRNAIRSLDPVRPHGPWWALCDNEAFMRAPLATAAHRRLGVQLWQIPPRSPDLNPVVSP